MFNYFRRDNIGIALDIGSSAIKLVQLLKTRDGVRLLNYGMRELSPDVIMEETIVNSFAVEEAIKELLQEAKIRHKNVVTAVSGRAVIVKPVKLPKRPYEELKRSILWEAEQYVPFNISDVIVDFQILSEEVESGSGEMEVLLVAVKKEKVHAYIELLRKAGLYPEIIDVDSFAIINSFEQSSEMPSGTFALVNLGASIINIDILSQGKLRFTRDISLGGNNLTKAIQGELGVEYKEAEAIKKGMVRSERDITPVLEPVIREMVGEIERSISYFKATSLEVEIEKVVLSGGSARIPLLEKALRERMPTTKIEIANPFQRMELELQSVNPEELKKVAPLFSVSTGLALRKLF
jgi:type IV pilus assembly protein PilM